MSLLNNNPNLDQDGRDSILRDLDMNLFVIAGAGSGKTSMLVARMVAMVESGIDISKICAITFTKKAAAEFLFRFQGELKKHSVSPKIEEIKQKRCKTALEKIDLCFTGTIDSFCNLVLSEYPNNAEIPSSSMVVEEDEFISLCKKEYEKIANDLNSPIRNEFEDFNRLVRNGADTFSRSINDVIDVSHLNIKYPVPTKSLDETVNDFINKYEAKIQSDVRLLLSMESDLYLNDDKNRPQDRFAELKKESNKLLKKWDVTNFITIKKAIKNIFAKDDWFRFDCEPLTQFFEFKQVKQQYANKKKNETENLKAYLDDVDKIIYMYSLHFLVSAANTIKENLKAQGKLSFTEYLMTFRNMVIEDMNNGMKLINHIRQKHKYFLIDESQDTSPAQTELFIYLTSECVAHSLEECKPIPGSIFIVGDPKQSIYGFRGADVQAYLNTKTLFESVYDPKYNKVVYLTKNFRSVYALRSYFNDRFINLPNYEPIPLDPDKTPKEMENEVLSGVYTSIDYLIAIQQLVGKHYIFDTKALKKRLIEYKDIMLLTWSTTNHDKVIKKLNEHNIPVYCEGRFTINECQIIETIYAIYGYVANKEGQFQNLLSSPLFNINPNDLLGISNVDDLPNGKEKEFILSLESLRSIDNPVILLDTIIQKLKLFKIIDFANMEYALFALEIMKEQYASLKVSDVKSGETFLRDFLSTKLERCMNLEYSPNAVNLANVHKVKGLEKPVVIIVDGTSPKKAAKNDSNYLNNEAYVFRTGEVNLGTVKIFEIECGDLFVKEEEIAQKKKEEESERLGYVAVTRARNVLVLPSNNARSDNPWKSVQIDNPKEIPYSDLPDVAVKTAGIFSFTEPKEMNVKNTYKEKRPSSESHISNKYSEEAEDAVEEEVANDIDSRTKGTLIHKLMQKIVNSKGKLPKEQLINNILNEYSLDESSPYKDILYNVYVTIFNGGFPQTNGVSIDILPILFKSNCQCEVPFAYKEKDNIWQGEIDLVYELDGQYYIVDYKTNADDSELEKIYKQQLEAYKKVLKLSLGVDAITYIYHIGS